jgi:hypothetical protein
MRPFSPFQQNPGSEPIRQIPQAQVDRWIAGDGRKASELDAAVMDIQNQLRAGLPLRSFKTNVKWRNVEAGSIRKGQMLFSDPVFVYAFTATVLGLKFDDQDGKDFYPGIQFSTPNAYVLVEMTTSSNEQTFVGSQNSDYLPSFIPLSEAMGTGELPGYILPQAFARATTCNLSISLVEELFLIRASLVSITAHYLRLPIL